MKRWEYIQKDGTLVSEQDKNTVAKMLINTDDKTNRFYVMLSGGELFDPQETSSTYLKRRTWKFRLVPYEVYNLYLRYLGYPDRKTLGTKAFKLQAERII
jgi:hypothetical protein